MRCGSNAIRTCFFFCTFSSLICPPFLTYSTTLKALCQRISVILSFFIVIFTQKAYYIYKEV
uniref:Uncharacterized protein n=1 Tax=Siphoviridae sp. ctVDC13 TaxID=2827880 RepID=A0A8S5TC11_9CAUD|nr:MAG TPA: hypothetical protein [Siphoviridae sp. ctVDC13]